MDDERKLTINDPVSKEEIQAFGHIEDAKIRVSMELLSLEQRRIQLLSAAKKIDEQHGRLFEQILVNRGLSPDTRVELDPRTGALKLLDTSAPTPIPEAAPIPEAPTST